MAMKSFVIAAAVSQLLVKQSAGLVVELNQSNDHCSTKLVVQRKYNQLKVKQVAKKTFASGFCINPKDDQVDKERAGKALPNDKIVLKKMEVKKSGEDYELKCYSSNQFDKSEDDDDDEFDISDKNNNDDDDDDEATVSINKEENTYFGGYVFHPNITHENMNPELYQRSGSFLARHKPQNASVTLMIIGTRVSEPDVVRKYEKFCTAIGNRAIELNGDHLNLSKEEKAERRGIIQEVEKGKEERLRNQAIAETKRLQCLANVDNHMNTVRDAIIKLSSKGGAQLSISDFGLTHKLPEVDSAQLATGVVSAHTQESSSTSFWSSLVGSSSKQSNTVERVTTDDQSTLKKWSEALDYYNALTMKYNVVDSSGNPDRIANIGWTLLKPGACDGDSLIEVDTHDRRYELNDEPLARTMDSVIFSARCENCDINVPKNVVFKYTNNCRLMNTDVDTLPEDTIVDLDTQYLEFLIPTIAWHLSFPITLRVFSVSAAAIPEEWPTVTKDSNKEEVQVDGDQRMQSEYFTEHGRQCGNSGKSSIRGLVVEKFDKDLNGLLRKHQSSNAVTQLKLAINAGIETIKLLKTLHLEIGFIHGDIHQDNVGFVDGRYVLFDFGFSRFFPEDFTKPIKSNGRFGANKLLLASGPLSGYRDGRSADIERAIEIIPNQFSVFKNDCYYEYLKGLDQIDLINFKKTGMYFTTKYLWKDGVKSQTFCEMFGLINDTCNKAMGFLNEALTNVRSKIHPDDVPDYEGILKLLQDAYNLISSIPLN